MQIPDLLLSQARVVDIHKVYVSAEVELLGTRTAADIQRGSNARLSLFKANNCDATLELINLLWLHTSSYAYTYNHLQQRLFFD